MHRMGYRYWATETKRTNTSNGFSRNYGAKDQRSLGWGHQGRGLVAGGCSVSQPLTHGKDPGLKKACGGETTNNFQLAFSSTMPWLLTQGAALLHAMLFECVFILPSSTGWQEQPVFGQKVFFYLLERSQCCSERGCLSKVQTLECKGLDYIHCNLSLLSADDLFLLTLIPKHTSCCAVLNTFLAQSV